MKYRIRLFLLINLFRYAFLIFDEGMLDQLGKELPSGIGMETGATSLERRTYSNTVDAVNRRRRQRKR